jgi:hypothetical protein
VLAFLGLWVVSLGWLALSVIVLSDASLARPATEQFLSVTTRWQSPTTRFLPEFAPVVVTDDATVRALPETTASAATEPQVTELTSEPIRVSRGYAGAQGLAHLWHERLSMTPVYGLVEPFRRLYDPSASWNEFFFYGLGAMWSLLVWSWIGGALTRAAAVRLGRDERCGFRDSLDFAQRKLGSYLAAPLLPLAAITMLALPMFFLGLLMRSGIGVAIAGLIWPLLLPAAFVMALFAIGLLFGWPLMFAAISTEGSDAFDALSRSYAYTFQRPLQYLIYGLAASVLGGLGWLLVGLFCEAVIQFSFFAIGVGAGGERLDLLLGVLNGTQESPGALFSFGSAIIGFLNRSVYAVQVAFGYSYLWAAAVAVYLLLRRDADHTEMDDVFVDEQDGAAYGLPPLTLDPNGVPATTAESAPATPTVIASEHAANTVSAVAADFDAKVNVESPGSSTSEEPPATGRAD